MKTVAKLLVLVLVMALATLLISFDRLPLLSAMAFGVFVALVALALLWVMSYVEEGES